MGLNDAQAEEFVLQKLQPMAWQVYNTGGNVAETVYKLAQNYGYAAKIAKPDNISLKNIQKNSPKSQSMIDDVAAAVTSVTNNPTAYTKMENFANLDRESGQGTDPHKFRKALAAFQSAQRA